MVHLVVLVGHGELDVALELCQPLTHRALDTTIAMATVTPERTE